MSLLSDGGPGSARCVACVVLLGAATAGCGRLSFEDQPLTLIFRDDNQATFDLGTYDSGSALLAWTGSQVRLAGAAPFDTAQTGIYVSRPFDTGDATTVWDTLAWIPTAPQGKPLPDGGSDDVGYAVAGLSMADDILLLHFDGTSIAQGAKVADSSGLGHHGQMVLSGQSATLVPGLFGQALDLERDAWVTLDGNDFDYGTGDFTYAVWVKMYGCAESNDNRIALGGAGAGDDPHMWLGALCPDACTDGDGAFMNFLDDTRQGPTLSACTGVVLDDGNWHLLAGVKQGHTAPPAVVRLYVDGREVGATTYDFGADTLTYDGGEIRLGSFNLNDPQYNTRITVDEAAIWKRALTAEQIEALYRRGAAHLRFQIRACPDRVCDTEPFVGPDGTGDTYFTEADLVGPAGSQHGNLAPLGLVAQVAQYRALFSTASPAFSPGLAGVTLQATRP